MKLLVVTRSSVSTGDTLSDHAGSAAQAIALWRAGRHSHVFADIGDLGDGMTGPRLAIALRKEAGGDAVVISLMADSVQPIHIAWAGHCGADHAIRRSAAAIVAVLGSEGGHAPTQPGDLPAESARTLNATTELVASRLHSLARMGPARSIVVTDAVDQYVKEHAGAVPSASQLARLVAADIPRDADRAAFLKSFTGEPR